MKEKTKFYETEWFWTIFWIVVGGSLITLAIYYKFFSPGVPKSQQIICKQIILREFPDFENKVKELIKEKNPRMVGVWKWRFRKTDRKDVIIARYGIIGVDWLEQLIEILTLGYIELSWKGAVFVSVKVSLNDSTAVIFKEDEHSQR